MATTRWSDLFAGKNAGRSATLGGGVALHAVNVYIATSILPSVVADIGGLAFYAWNTTLFVMGSLLGAVLCGRALAWSAPRILYRLACVLFGAGSLVCATAPSMPAMLVGRTLQGLGGGLLCALSYAMIRQFFPRALWPRAVGMVSAMWGISTLSGPAIGGIFADFGAWRLAFWTLLPLTAAMLLTVERVAGNAGAPPGPSSPSGRTGGFPGARLTLLLGGVMALSGGSLSGTAAWNAAGLFAATICLAAMMWAERRATNRLLPAGALSITTRIGAIYLTMSFLVVGTTVEIFIPYFMQILHGASPLTAGYVTATMSIGWSGASMAASGLGVRGTRGVAAAGPVVMAMGLAGLGVAMPVPGDGVAVVVVCLCLGLVGAGVGMGWPHLLSGAMEAVREADRDLASASIMTVQLVAMAFGTAFGGMVANLAGMSDPGGAAGAANAALWVFPLFAAIAALAGVPLLLRRAPGKVPG